MKNETAIQHVFSRMVEMVLSFSLHWIIPITFCPQREAPWLTSGYT